MNILLGGQNIFVAGEYSYATLVAASRYIFYPSTKARGIFCILYQGSRKPPEPALGLPWYAKQRTFTCYGENLGTLTARKAWLGRSAGLSNPRESTGESRRPPWLFWSPEHKGENGVPKFWLLIFMKVFWPYQLVSPLPDTHTSIRKPRRSVFLAPRLFWRFLGTF